MVTNGQIVKISLKTTNDLESSQIRPFIDTMSKFTVFGSIISVITFMHGLSLLWAGKALTNMSLICDITAHVVCAALQFAYARDEYEKYCRCCDTFCKSVCEKESRREIAHAHSLANCTLTSVSQTQQL